jgi:hypothetical protein
MSPKAVEMTDDYLDLFEVPVVDSAIEHKEYAVYFDDNSETFTGPKTNAYVIRTKDLNSFLDMRNAFLEVEVTSSIGTVGVVTAVAGVAPAGVTKGVQSLGGVAAFNNASIFAANNAFNAARQHFNGHVDTAIIMKNAWSLFNNVRYTVNEVTLEDISEPQECSDMRLYSKLSPDTAKIYENMNFYAPGELTPENWFGNNYSTKQRCVIPLTSLLGSIESYKLSRGLKHALHLTPQNNLAQVLQSIQLDEADRDDATLVGPALSNVSLYISRLRLWVPIAQPSLKAILDYDREIDAGSETIRLFEGMRHYFSTPSSATQQNWYVTSEDQHIKRIYVWVKESADEVSYTEKNYLRGIDTLSSIKLRINSEILPREELSMDLAVNSRDAQRAYQMFLDATGKSQWDSDNEPLLSYEDWVSKQQIFIFSIPQRYDAFDSRQSDIHVEVRFSSVAAPYVIHAVIETEGQMMISGADNRVSMGLTRVNLLDQ